MRLNKQAIAYVLLPLWLAAVVFAFWWYKLRLISDLSQYQVDELFSAEHMVLAESDTPSDITIYHFFDKSCPCSKFNTEHVQDVNQKYKDKGVALIVVVPAQQDLMEAKLNFPDAKHIVANDTIQPPASPSLLITSQGKPEYIGPWSPGAICNGAEEDFASQVVDTLLTGSNYGFIRNYAKGCMCPWPKQIS